MLRGSGVRAAHSKRGGHTQQHPARHPPAYRHTWPSTEGTRGCWRRPAEAPSSCAASAAMAAAAATAAARRPGKGAGGGGLRGEGPAALAAAAGGAEASEGGPAGRGRLVGGRGGLSIAAGALAAGPAGLCMRGSQDQQQLVSLGQQLMRHSGQQQSAAHAQHAECTLSASPQSQARPMHLAKFAHLDAAPLASLVSRSCGPCAGCCCWGRRAGGRCWLLLCRPAAALCRDGRGRGRARGRPPGCSGLLHLHPLSPAPHSGRRSGRRLCGWRPGQWRHRGCRAGPRPRQAGGLWGRHHAFLRGGTRGGTALTLPLAAPPGLGRLLAGPFCHTARLLRLLCLLLLRG